MRVHHLNCATMCPRGGRLINEERRMVGHCLLVETQAGLVLVDTGFGKGDIAERGRLGRLFLTASRPVLSEQETALVQMEDLGFSAADVRHIVVTHLDRDHAGGLGDFPQAQVHVHRAELAAARARASRAERDRYVSAQWAHGPKWVEHEASGESWFGFEAVRAIGGLEDAVMLVPLAGHTRGHCAVAVKSPNGWLLHCGDAYFHHREMDPADPSCTFGLKLFQRMTEVDGRQRRHNQERLRELVREHGGEVTAFCAHDPRDFTRLSSKSGA